MKIYFHIGQAKTGTSAIQSFLNINRELLASKYKILYPNIDSPDPSQGCMYNHTTFYDSIHDDTSKDTITKLMHCLRFAEQNDIQKIVFSSEKFEFEWLPELILQIVETIKIDYQIILYLRRQDNYLESAWKQWGHKQKDINSIYQFANVLHMNWHETILHWLKYIKPEKFIVRPYEKSSIGENVVSDFISILGINNLSDFFDPSDSNFNKNHGLNADVIEIMRLCKNINSDLHHHRLIDFIYNSLPEYYKKKPMVSYGILSPVERLNIIESYSDSNKQVAKIFFGGNTELFHDPLPDINEPWTPNGGLSLESVIPVLMELIFKQYNDILGLKKALYRDNLFVNLSNHDLFNMSIYNDQIENIKMQNNGIHFQTKKDDPIIILPKLKLPKVSITIKLDITVPTNSFIQLFYKTSLRASYCELNSIKMQTIQGRQIIMIRIPAIKITGRLRLDPGNHPGDYIIHKIEFYC